MTAPRTPRAPPWAALAALNVAAVIFGTTALYGKLNVSPVWIVAGRAVFAAATLLILGRVRRVAFRTTPAMLARIAGTGVLLALHWLTFFMSVQQAGVAVATLTFATFPLMTILLEAVLHRRPPALIEIGTGLIIVGAVALLVGRGLPAMATAGDGAVVGLLSAVCFGAFSVASQRLGRDANPIALSLFQNLTVAALMLALTPLAQLAPHGWDWAGIATLGVVATALMHQLYFFALRRLPVAVCSGFVAIEPVYAIVFAAILFAEPIHPTVIVSGALIFGASILLLAGGKAPTVTPE